MEKSFVEKVATNISLESLRLLIEQREASSGELLAISPFRQEASWLTFKYADTPPSAPIRLSELDGEEPVDVPGYAIVCIGDAYIGSAIKGLACYRKVN